MWSNNGLKAFTYHQVIIYYCETIFEVLDNFEESNQFLVYNQNVNGTVNPKNKKNRLLNKKSKFFEGKDVITKEKQIKFNNLVIDLTIILEQLKPNISTIVLSMIYMDRLLKISPEIINSNEISLRNIILISLNLATKYNEDVIFSDKKFSFVTKLDLKNFIQMEVVFLYLINFRLFVDCEIFNYYFKNFKLGLIKIKQDYCIQNLLPKLCNNNETKVKN